MRIALLSSDWRPTGGVATYVRSLARALSDAGHQVLVLHGDAEATAEDSAGFDVVAVPRALVAASARDSGLVQRTLDAVAAFSPDVVHVQSNNNFPLEDALRRRWPLVKTFHVHEYCPAGTKYHFGVERPCAVPTSVMCVPRMAYLRCTLSRRPNVIWSFYRHTARANRRHKALDPLVVCSEHLKRQAVLTGFDANRVTVVPYFTTTTIPAAPAASREILFVGRLVRSKGVDLLLDALAHVHRSWRAVIAGAGPELAALKQRAAASGQGDRVAFPGWLTGQALSNAYSRAEIVVLPSRWPEPFGIVGLEALAHGRAVVAFNVGGIPEWLEEGVGGSLVPPLDTRALAARIEWMLDRPVETARMAELGLTRVAREFSAAAHLAKLLPVYERARALA